MRSSSTDRPTRIVGAIPYVWVADVSRALPYYRDVLGFELEFHHEWDREGAHYGLALVERDGVRLHLRVCECPDRRHTGTSFYQLEVEGLDALHAELAAAGALVRFEPTTQEWGVRDFQVDDPEGNRIYFYEHV